MASSYWPSPVQVPGVAEWILGTCRIGRRTAQRDHATFGHHIRTARIGRGGHIGNGDRGRVFVAGTGIVGHAKPHRHRMALVAIQGSRRKSGARPHSVIVLAHPRQKSQA